MGIRISWTDNNSFEDGFRVYRSTSSIDPEALPPAIADLGPDSTFYDDGDVTADQTYYYRVSSYYGSIEQVSEEILVTTTGFEPTDLSLLMWFDPSDLSTLWQDTAGTVPVTADGQSVARIDDKSGNNYHLVQGTASKRPVYRIDGSRHWLEADGTDDKMDVNSEGGSAVTYPAYWTLAAGYRAVNPSSTPFIADADDSSFNYRLGQIMRASANVGTYGMVFNSSNSTFNDHASVAITSGQDIVGTVKRGDGYIEVYTDAFTDGPSPTTGSPRIGGYPFAIFGRARTGASYVYMQGRIYGIVMANGVLSDTDRLGLEQWLAIKSGVTL